MAATEVEEVFTIESGNDLIDAHVIAIRRRDEGQRATGRVTKHLSDTSFLIFSEGLDSPRRIGLIKIGPDNYYALRKEQSLIYQLTGNVFVFPAQDSIDLPLDEEQQWILLQLKSERPYLLSQFQEVLSYFATVVIEIPGAVLELEAIKRLNLVPGLALYPSLTPATSMSTSRPRGQQWEEVSAPVGGRPPSPSAPAKGISKGIVTGAEYVAFGFNAGTVFAAQLVHKGGDHLINNYMAYDPKTVDPQVLSTLKKVRSGAETCSTVADAAVGKVAEGARYVGQLLVPHIQTHGTRLMSHATGKDAETSGRYVSDILSVTGSGLQGFSTICQSATASAKALSKAVAGETVRYVQRRYGDDAAEATNEALYAAGNVALAATAVRELAPKAIVKKAAKEAAKEGVSVLSSGGATRA